MQKMDELRSRQIAITEDFKSRAQKAEKILGEIDVCEKRISTLNEALSAVLLIDVMKAAVAAEVPKVKSAKAATVKAAKLIKVPKPPMVVPAAKPPAGQSLKDIVRDFLAREGKPMKIAEIVQGMRKAGHVFQATKPVVAMRFLIYNNKNRFKKVARGTFVAVTENVQKPEVAAVAKVKVVKANPAAEQADASTLKGSVRDFMLKAGKPMKIAEIVKAMQKAGHVFQSKKPATTLRQLMYNHAKVFKRVKPGTFKAV